MNEKQKKEMLKDAKKEKVLAKYWIKVYQGQLKRVERIIKELSN